MKISLTELLQILADKELILTLQNAVSALLAERASLKQQILDLLAGDAATLAKANAAFAKSEAVEAKMRDYVATRP